MLQIGDTIISLDVIERKFVCDLSQCKGYCCVEGESGAPLEKGEKKILEKILPEVWRDLRPEARKVIEQRGVAGRDSDGDMVTSIVNGKDCVFTCYDESGVCKCAIEKACREGRVSFYKPISCHLYPVKVKQFSNFKGVNYHRWDVCRIAETLGEKAGVPVYKFLKEPLIRKFGQEWYEQLEIAAEMLNSKRLIK